MVQFLRFGLDALVDSLLQNGLCAGADVEIAGCERDGHYGMVRNHAQGILLRPDDQLMPGPAPAASTLSSTPVPAP